MKIYPYENDGVPAHLWRITTDDYDKLYIVFRARIKEIDNRLFNLQKAEDDYYLKAGQQ